MFSSRIQRQLMFCVTVAAVTAVAGCSTTGSSRYGDLPAVPVRRVPAELLKAETRTDLQELTLTRLRQDPPPVYLIGPGDVLGVYIENVLGQPDEAPAVHFPETDDRPPAVGFPIVVREDGSIALPLVPALQVEGLSLTETEGVIRRAYTADRSILREGQDRILVTLMRRRTHRVLVVREEVGAQEGVTKRGTGVAVDLAAYENDVLHALSATGGMPGLDARNEIIIMRGQFADATQRDEMLNSVHKRYRAWARDAELESDENFVRIPLRFSPDNPPQFTQDDIKLHDGDIVLIKARDREVFYTGGVLSGGQYPIPRDYDLDILGAIALASGPVGSGGSAISQIGNNDSQFITAGRGAAVAPSQAIVLRTTPSGEQIPIRVNLRNCMTNPRERILIQPEDVIIVRYTMEEEVMNTLMGLFRFNVLFDGMSPF